MVRVFVQLRTVVATHAELSRPEELERKFEKHDSELQYVFEAIRELMALEPVLPKRGIGFPPKKMSRPATSVTKPV